MLLIRYHFFVYFLLVLCFNILLCKERSAYHFQKLILFLTVLYSRDLFVSFIVCTCSVYSNVPVNVEIVYFQTF